MKLQLNLFKVLLLLLAIALLPGLVACNPQETELPFETIERYDLSQYIGPPRVILITTRPETDRLKGLVSQQALDQLAALDFQQFFAIALFRGRQANTGYDTIIERVTRQDNRIVVYAQFWEPSPFYAVNPSETSPYHVIKVNRDNGAIQEAESVLQSRLITPTPPSH